MTQSAKPLLSLSALTRHFGATRAVDGIDLSIGEGEIHALIGPSGCGKSTLLRLIAGFEPAQSGTIVMQGADITRLPPENRDIGIVFQDYALFPHLDVEANIGFGLDRLSRAERRERIAAHIAMLGLRGLEKRFPDELSGGQQQRVALARSLAARPAFLLLDEPFSNLDAALRASARRDIRLLLKELGIGVLIVTHDREEALSLADRISVMKDGRLEQTGTPEEIYARPQNAFVAGFLGATNLVAGTGHGDTASTVLGEIAIAPPAHGAVTLSLRPEDVAVIGEPTGDDPRFEVVEHLFHGAVHACRLRAENGTELEIHATRRFEPGESLRLHALRPAAVVAKS